MKPTLMVLAAGIGSRYGGLKQLDPVGPHGEVVIDYSIYDALRAGFGKLVFIIRRDIEQAFRDQLGRTFEDKVDVEYAFQELDQVPQGFTVPPDRKKPWGTGHAVLAGREVIDEPFAVINADDFYGAHAYHLLSDYLVQAGEQEYGLVGFVMRNTLSEHGSVARAICETDADSILQSVEEKTKLQWQGDRVINEEADGSTTAFTGDELVSMNMWGFTPSFFPHLEEHFAAFLERHGHEPKAELYIPAVVDSLIRQDRARVKVLPSHDSWFGVTYKEDKPRVVQSIGELTEEGRYPSPLWDHGS